MFARSVLRTTRVTLARAQQARTVVTKAPKVNESQQAYQANGHLHGADNPVRAPACAASRWRSAASPPPPNRLSPPSRRALFSPLLQTFLKAGSDWTSFLGTVGFTGVLCTMMWSGMSNMRNGTNKFD